MKEITIRIKGRPSVLGDQIGVADTTLTRFFGLMGRTSLAEGAGLWIRPSSGIHTFWMRMHIDVVALDADLRVIGLAPHVPPWRIRALSLRTRTVVELPAGQIERCGVALGDTLEIVHAA
jgi:uncharacterized membrane protein (UPF0127 family)